MKVVSRRIYQFGSFCIDAEKRVLMRDGEVVPLKPKAFDTLIILVQHHGEVLEKDALMDMLWPDSDVEESNLAQHISALRKALGESPNERRYIVTVPGRGYRFAAEISQAEEEPAEMVVARYTKATVVVHDKEEDQAPEPEIRQLGVVRRRSPKTLAVIATALVLLIASAIALYFISDRRNPGSKNIRSIAILPFANNDPAAEYLGDGIAESLINSLSQMTQLKVIARSSSFRYKGKDVDPKEVAQSLGVEMILTGSVWRHGEQIQIGVELMDVRDKTHIWGEQYNRAMSDLLMVQAEIAGEIARKLSVKLTTAEQQQLAKHETVNPQAYELVLRGRFYKSNKSGTENQKKAIEYFQQAIALDPTYAPAYAELSAIFRFLITISVLDPKEFTPKAEAAAQKALELDDSLADAHLALAGIKVINWDWAAAEREYHRALELNPNLAVAHSRYGGYLSLMGRHDEAIAEGKRARDLDPLSLNTNWGIGYQFLLARRNDEAIEVAKKLIELDQSYPDAYALLAYGYEAKGQYVEAISAYQQAIRMGDHSPDTQIYFGTTYAKAGEREKARAILKRLEADPKVSREGISTIYVALGEYEQAFAALERAYEAHDSQLQFLKISPHNDPLRSDPRYQDLMRRVGLPE